MQDLFNKIDSKLEEGESVTIFDLISLSEDKIEDVITAKR